MTGYLDAAHDLLSRHPLIDGHNDLPWALRGRHGAHADAVDLTAHQPGHTDLLRLAKGGVGGQFWSVYVPVSLAGEAAVATTLEQIDFVRRMVCRFPDAFALALTSDEVEQARAAGKVASLIGAEGGHSIACSLGVLRAFYDLGVRYMTLTHWSNVPWADAATDVPAAGGLTDFGRVVVGEMQRLGMLVDLSHVSADTMRDTMDAASGPVVFSHSSARALCDHPRNVPDEVLARLPANGGVCMATFVPSFISQECRDWDRELTSEIDRRGVDPWDGEARAELRREWERDHPVPRATLRQAADHVAHVREVAGIDNVGIGGDFDGTDDVTQGLSDVSCYPALIAELLARGWSSSDCARLTRGNTLRVLREAEAVSRDLASRQPPATARIEDTDGPAGRDMPVRAG